MQARTYRAE